MLRLHLKIIDNGKYRRDIKKGFFAWRLCEDGIGISDDRIYRSEEDAIKAAEKFARKLGMGIKNVIFI